MFTAINQLDRINSNFSLFIYISKRFQKVDKELRRDGQNKLIHPLKFNEQANDVDNFLKPNNFFECESDFFS